MEYYDFLQATYMIFGNNILPLIIDLKWYYFRHFFNELISFTYRLVCTTREFHNTQSGKVVVQTGREDKYHGTSAEKFTYVVCIEKCPLLQNARGL